MGKRKKEETKRYEPPQIKRYEPPQIKTFAASKVFGARCTPGGGQSRCEAGTQASRTCNAGSQQV